MADSSDYATCEVCESIEICLISESFGDQESLFKYRLFLCKDEGHKVCGECLDGFDEDTLSEDELVSLEEEGCVPSRFCPICLCKTPTDAMLLEFVLQDYGVTREEMILKMQAKYK